MSAWGDVPNVVFPCAALTDADTGRIAIYYGCADTVTGLAFTTVEELVQYTKTLPAEQGGTPMVFLDKRAAGHLQTKLKKLSVRQRRTIDAWFYKKGNFIRPHDAEADETPFLPFDSRTCTGTARCALLVQGRYDRSRQL